MKSDNLKEIFTLWDHPIMPFDEVIQSCYPINKGFSKGTFVKKHG